MNGLELLTFLRNNGIQIIEALPTTISEDLLRKHGYKKGTRPSELVVDILTGDTSGNIAGQFKHYYPTPINGAGAGDTKRLLGAFRGFVQNILLSEEEPIPLPHTKEISREPDILLEKIEVLVVEIRGEWLTWSVGKGYLDILEQMGTLLPLLREKYRNPMLESEASTMEERIIDDVIPDEYITFLYDIMITFYHIYTVKIAKIQDDLSLWPSNITLINSIHAVAKTLYYDMAWTIFDMSLGKPQSIGDLCTNIIEGINTVNFIVQENRVNETNTTKSPTEE